LIKTINKCTIDKTDDNADNCTQNTFSQKAANVEEIGWRDPENIPVHETQLLTEATI